MSILDQLCQPGGPSLVQAAMSAHELERLGAQLAAAHPDAMVRRIRGHKARTLQAFFDEIAAALQLPLSFGEDWNALIDVARDLEISHRGGVVVLVAHAGWLLADQRAERPAFVATMAQLHAEWRARDLPFQVVLPDSPRG